MKTEGKDKKEIGAIFGIEGETSIKYRVSLGRIPTIMKLGGQSVAHLSFKEAIDYLLPLRIEKSREESGAPIWDYSEVTACIGKLVSTAPKTRLTKDDLPTYSADRRVAIKEAQQDARLKEIAAQEVAAWKEKLSAKDSEVKEAPSKLTAEIKRLQDEAKIFDNSCCEALDRYITDGPSSRRGSRLPSLCSHGNQGIRSTFRTAACRIPGTEKRQDLAIVPMSFSSHLSHLSSSGPF
jgi:hypothetical protein